MGRRSAWLHSLGLVGAGLVLMAPGFAAPMVRGVPDSETRMTVGPAVLPYADLAQKLSAPGRRVTCDGDLDGAAAFVFLRDRTWTDARRLLQSGLDVQVVATNPERTRWRLRRDPRVAERERRWRQALTAALVSRLRGELAAWQEVLPLARTSRQSLLDQEGMLGKEQDELAQRGADPAAREEIQRRLDRVRRAISLKSSAYRLGVSWLESALLRLPPDLLTVTPAPELIPVGPISKRQIEEEQGYESTPGSSVSFDLSAGQVRVGMDEGSIRISAQFGLLSPDIESAITEDLASDLSDLRIPARRSPEGSLAQELAQILPCRTPEEKRLLEEAQTPERSFFSTPDAGREFVSTSRLPIDSLSQIVEAWSQALNREALMELAPAAEGIEKAFNVYTVSPTGRKFTLAAVGTKLERWSWREKEGVLLVRNPLAFLDRSAKRPFAAGLRLAERHAARLRAGKPDAPVPQVLLNYPSTDAELAEYFHASPALFGGGWRHPFLPVNIYRGVRWPVIRNAGMIGWQLVPAEVKARIRSAQASGETKAPLTGRSRLELERLTLAVRMTSSDDWNLLHPRLPEKIAEEGLTLRWSPAPAGEQGGLQRVECSPYRSRTHFMLTHPGTTSSRATAAPQ